MPQIKVECLYCGHEFEEYLYTIDQAEYLTCKVCKDKHLRVIGDKRDDNRDPFGYNYDSKKGSK